MSQFTIALLVTLAFAVGGWALGGVSAGGAAAGWVVAFVLYYGIGPGAFGVLFAVFAITWITTNLGRRRKQTLGIAERGRGRRSAGQVLANIGVSGICSAIIMAGNGHSWAVAAAIGALAEAAADTSSSECGEAASDTAFLVPHFRRVPAGSDGAITILGTMAGAVAAAVVAAVAAGLHVLPDSVAAVAGAAGIAGMLIDTVLGATLERRGFMNNNAVNFSSTLASAVLAAALAAWMG
jgi:uncharacterized protein (TIGR00297 family)